MKLSEKLKKDLVTSKKLYTKGQWKVLNEIIQRILPKIQQIEQEENELLDGLEELCNKYCNKCQTLKNRKGCNSNCLDKYIDLIAKHTGGSF